MSTALYRRYRPETFAEVIGQDHVTAPLMQALRSGRVNHAYLFSGPRGCGKTTSARILARTLNCEQNTPEHPIDTPCGTCPSCVDLARGGPGSLDVVEIDAASHGGVDDARDLRERATFAPTRDRFKIFIIDEAHMVSPAGFNALLKIVEEPPEHVKFVFATTEPDKVIGTIRSRTHHYPFRLVPPDVLGPYLEELCRAEGVEVGSGVFPLVTRAGGGSVRDSLSVMDQLIAGAENGQVDYERAVALLGYTHATLLDDVVDALAARDGASIFRVVDHVIATGHEPRRFVEDVLERLRDLIVIAVSGDEAQAVLRDQPADQLVRMRTQAQNLGVSELSRAADLTNDALTEMSGATSPRMHLELLVARLLLPGADDGVAGFAARLDRLERGGLGAGPAVITAPVPDAAPSPRRSSAAAPGPGPAAAAAGLTGAAAVRAAMRPDPPDAEPAPAAPPTESVPARAESAPAPAPADPAAADVPVPNPRSAPLQRPEESPTPGSAEAEEGAGAPATAAPASDESPEPPRPAVPASPSAPTTSGTPSAGLTTEELRRRWPEVLETLRASRSTWSLVGPNAQVSELGADVLYLAFPSPGLARAFSSSRHTGAVQDAVYQTLGLQVRVEPRLAEGGPGGDGGSSVQPAPLAPQGTAEGGSAGSTISEVAGAPGPGPTGEPTDERGPGGGPVGGRSSDAAPSSSPAPVAQSVAFDSAGARPAGPRGGVALQERAEPHPSVEEAIAPASTAVDAADEAWLAGVRLHEPPDDLDDAPAPEDDPGRPAPRASSPVASTSTAAPGENATPTAPVPEGRGTASGTAGPRVRETPRQAAERREAERRQAAATPVTAPSPMDDDVPSADDPDIVSTGLVGAALVAKLLDGKIIEEIQDPGA